jgi:hypothetical protein
MTDNLPAKVGGIRYPGGYDPEGRPPTPMNPNVPICGGHRSNGELCRAPACRKPDPEHGYVYGRCRMHGGTRWRYALERKQVPLAEKIQTALTDFELQDSQQQVMAAAGIVREYMDMMEEQGDVTLEQMSKLLQMTDTLSKIAKRDSEMREGKKLFVKVEILGDFQITVAALAAKHFAQYPEAVEGFCEELEQVRIPNG